MFGICLPFHYHPEIKESCSKKKKKKKNRSRRKCQGLERARKELWEVRFVWIKSEGMEMWGNLRVRGGKKKSTVLVC